jgi:predicted nucleotidyltransferase
MVRVLPEAIDRALRRYRHELDRRLPGKLRRLTVFGSMARGQAHEASDVDVLVLLDEPTFAERRDALDLAGSIGLEHDLVLAPVVLSLREWSELERRERALPREIARDGVDA